MEITCCKSWHRSLAKPLINLNPHCAHIVQFQSKDLIYREIADPHNWFWLIVNVKGHPIPSPCFIISRWNVSKGLIYFKRGNPHGWFWLTVVESECECQPEFDFIQTWNCWLAYLKDELRRDKTELLAYLKPTIRVKFNVSRNFVRMDISKVIINLVPFLENSCSREKQDLMSASKYMLIFNLFIFWFSDLWCERNLIA